MPPLTPDSKKFKAVGLLKQSQLKAVSLVEEIGTNKRFAAYQLKTPSTLSKEQAESRLAQEAAALRNVSHPNIPHFEGFLSTPTGNWFLFDYLEGYPLSQHKGDTDKVPDEWILFWFNQILSILEQLHSNHVIVGGFEPKHFLVHDDRLYLVHVGILENLFPETLALLRSPERLTFTAPEHRHSIQTSVAGDLYSAGAVAYWLCTGKPPSFGTHVPQEQVQSAILALRPKFPVDVTKVITRLIQFQVSNRYPSAEDAHGELKPLVPRLAGQTPPAPVKPYKVRFFGRETSARLNSEAVELEKKATPRPGAGKAAELAEAVAAATTESTTRGLSNKTPVTDTARLGARSLNTETEKGGLDADTVKRSSAPLASATATNIIKEPVVEEKPAAPSALQEFMEDVIWSTFRRSPLVTFGVLVGLLLVGILVAWMLSGGGSKSAGQQGLSLVAGHIDVKVGNQAEWSAAQGVTAPESLVVATQHNSPTVLKFGHNGRIRLEERSTFRFEGINGDTLHMRLVEGHAWVEPGNGDGAEVDVGVNVVTCPSDSSAEFTVGESASGEAHEPTVKASQGSIQVKTLTGVTTLISGNSMNLSDSASPSPGASASPTEDTSSPHL